MPSRRSGRSADQPLIGSLWRSSTRRVQLSSPSRSDGEGDREAVEGLVGSDSIIYQRAAKMRRQMTPPEARLWRRLKGHKLAGLKFRRQHSIGPYILDFYCASAKL